MRIAMVMVLSTLALAACAGAPGPSDTDASVLDRKQGFGAGLNANRVSGR